MACIWLSFLSKKANIWGAEHPLCALYAHPPTCRASPYFANFVCSKRKPLLQMVLLSALNGGFLSSLVVMMAPTFSLCSLSLSLMLFLSSLHFLVPTDPESTRTHLSPHLFSMTEKRRWLLSLILPLTHILGTFKRGPSEFSRAILHSARPAYGRDECRSVLSLENVWYIQKSLVEMIMDSGGILVPVWIGRAVGWFHC